jgi:hypothetical protein
MRGVVPEALASGKLVVGDDSSEGYCDWLMSNSNGKIRY